MLNKIIFMNKVFAMVLLSASCFMAGCGSKSAGDPKTNDLSEFNPPSKLQTLTRSQKIVLTWVGSNAEDDFKGYYVFGTTRSLTQLKELAKFPSGVDVTAGGSIPRCKDNNGFFEAFGLPASTSDCTSSVIKGENSLLDSSSVKTPVHIAPRPSSTENKTESVARIDNKLECTGTNQKGKDQTLSLDPDGSALGRLYCDVEKAYDPGTKALVSLTNGTTYSFIVVAVRGDDNDEISWISNLVSDTPAHALFAQTIKLKAAKYRVFDIDDANFAASSLGDETACSGTLCKLGSSNTSTSRGIYVARDQTGTGFDQRILISTNVSSGIQLQARGPETSVDPNASNSTTMTYQKPDDQAQTTFNDAGDKFAVFGNQVFDLRITKAANQYLYGKVVLTNLSMPGTETSEAQFDLTIILQSAVNNRDYLFGM